MAPSTPLDSLRSHRSEEAVIGGIVIACFDLSEPHTGRSRHPFPPDSRHVVIRTGTSPADLERDNAG
jgi:hypothetical protein